jgi:hypothetical protein
MWSELTWLHETENCLSTIYFILRGIINCDELTQKHFNYIKMSNIFSHFHKKSVIWIYKHSYDNKTCHLGKWTTLGSAVACWTKWRIKENGVSLHIVLHSVSVYIILDLSWRTMKTLMETRGISQVTWNPAVVQLFSWNRSRAGYNCSCGIECISGCREARDLPSS